MLINLSNHPKSNWSEKQLSAAKEIYGDVIDLHFPQIPPDADEIFIDELAAQHKGKCLSLFQKYPSDNNAVHIMGEMTFSFKLVNELKKSNIVCVASTTDRNTTEENGNKISKFNFVRFRQY